MDLKATRKKLKLSQAQAGALCGVSRRTFWNWENEHTRTPVTAIMVLEQELSAKARKGMA